MAKTSAQWVLACIYFVMSLCSLLAVASPLQPTPAPTLSAAGNDTAMVGFVSEPNGRGTVSLLLSCLFTLSLCVWSALHLNVPAPGARTKHDLPLYIRWIVTGTFRPELLISVAWRQWGSAKTLGAIVEKAIKENQAMRGKPEEFDGPPTSNSLDTGSSNIGTMRAARRSHQWTLTHSLFAGSGGFAIEFQDGKLGHEQFLPTICPRKLVLTARGVALLARCGIIPDVSEADIWDKSKANGLAKFLVVVQAAWMFAQVLGRLILQLPVTLLEVNTVAHICCMFVCSALWWYKPFAPTEPILLRGDWVDKIGAFMYMSSDISGNLGRKQALIPRLFALSGGRFSGYPELDLVALQRDDHSESPPSPLDTTANAERAPTELSDDSVNECEGAFHMAPGSCMDRLRKEISSAGCGGAFFQRQLKVEIGPASNSEPAVMRNRWALAAAAIHKYPSLIEDTIRLSHRGDTCIHLKSQELVAERVSNWPGSDLLKAADRPLVSMIIWAASLVYGIIHIAAWNGTFPTDAEAWLWRASSCHIIFWCLFWTLFEVALRYYPRLRIVENSRAEIPLWQKGLVGIPNIICALGFVFARGYVVVEAFISVRSLPADAYSTPSWTQIFPHL